MQSRTQFIFLLMLLLTLVLQGEEENVEPVSEESAPTEMEAVAEAEVEEAVESETTDEAETIPERKLEEGEIYFAEGTPETTEKAMVYVVPIEGPINSPQLYILRRALKQAIEQNVNTVVLDMDTPGGALGVTLEMMEALDKFEGTTITFVNDEAISAGSYISIATDEIYFAPTGLMGAAEAVSSSGENINESMQRKINSYLRAKVRVLSSEHRYRADVQRAMMDPDFEFKIGDKVLSTPGELLSITADEAVTLYGEPEVPLLANGIAEDMDALLDARFGESNYEIVEFEVTWSEQFAKWFNTISPILMGLGMLLLFIEFKTPNFGLLGGAGICLILLVFASNYFAGMAGHEEVLIFALGVVLVAVELFVLPGSIIFGLAGLSLMIGSLIWALADIWPTPGGDGFELDPTVFYQPVMQVAMGLFIAVVGLMVVWRFLPNTWIWKQMVLESASDGTATMQFGGGIAKDLPETGAEGTTITDMFPSGEVEIAGRRYQARCEFGSLNKGIEVKVVGHRGDDLVVQAIG